MDELCVDEVIYRRCQAPGFDAYYISPNGSVYDSSVRTVKLGRQMLVIAVPASESDRKIGWSPTLSTIPISVELAKLWIPIPESCDEYDLTNLVACYKKDFQSRPNAQVTYDDMTFVPVKTWVKGLSVKNGQEQATLIQILKKYCKNVTYYQVQKERENFEMSLIQTRTYTDPKGHVWSV
jgi:hypothetical protein